MALNQCTFLGRLTREPDIRYAAETQMPIARFTLAVGRGTKKENEADADFITCVAFDKRAEFVERYLGKGIRIVVSGRLQNNNYTDKDGNVHVSGKTTLYDFERFFHTDLKAFQDSDIITIGGYMMEHYPNLKKGETIELEGYKFTLDSIEQGFMRWFIVAPINAKKKTKEKEKSSQK